MPGEISQCKSEDIDDLNAVSNDNHLVEKYSFTKLITLFDLGLSLHFKLVVLLSFVKLFPDVMTLQQH